jgi:hypothetical protein
LKSLTALLSSIATGDPSNEAETKGVAEEKNSADTNTEMQLIGRQGKHHFLVFQKNLASSFLHLP